MTAIPVIIAGLLIFGVGLWIASWVSSFVQGSNWPHKYLLALVARIAIIVLSLAMALTTMGLADSIVALAFGVPLIGVALAIGLAFGLGGRETAAKQLEQWQVSMKDVDQKLAWRRRRKRLRFRRRLINRRPNR